MGERKRVATKAPSQASTGEIIPIDRHMPFRFLDLSQEIRDLIYDHLMELEYINNAAIHFKLEPLTKELNSLAHPSCQSTNQRRIFRQIVRSKAAFQ